MSKLNKRPSVCGGYVSVVVNNKPSLALIDSGNLWRTIISEKMMNKLQLNKEELRPLSITALSTSKEDPKSLGGNKERRKTIYWQLSQTILSASRRYSGFGHGRETEPPFLDYEQNRSAAFTRGPIGKRKRSLPPGPPR